MDIVLWILLGATIFFAGRHIARRIANGGEELANAPYNDEYNL